MPSRFFAFLVGIDEYQSESVGNLDGCTKDIENIQRTLLPACDKAQVFTLLNAAATRHAILNSFRKHLTENPRISKDDSILVYFACNGKRLDSPQSAPRRHIDVLAPYDFSPEVAGISDMTLHALLCELAEKKGKNITLIIDSSFSRFFPGAANVRRSRAPVWPQAANLWDEHSRPYGGFFSGPQPPYTILVACEQDGIAQESADGGVFTKTLLAAFLEQTAATYRELVFSVNQRMPPSSRSPRVRQTAVCRGAYLDRPLFSVPAETPITKLRVFNASRVQLSERHEDCFVVVKKKRGAGIVLREGGGIDRTVIERRGGLVAAYSYREASLPSNDGETAVRTLNGIAQFNYFLTLGSPVPTALTRLSVLFASLAFWRREPSPKAGLEIYHFKKQKRTVVGPISPNLVRKGVGSLKSVPADHVFGAKITNGCSTDMYPYLFHFDPSTYAIQTVYTPFPKDTKLLPIKLAPNASLPLGYGDSKTPAFAFTVEEPRKERAAEFFKLILCEKPVDLQYILQESPLAPSLPFHPLSTPPPAIPKPWETTVVTISVPLSYGAVATGAEKPQPSMRERLGSRWKRLIDAAHRPK